MTVLTAAPLTAEAFAPFGDVIRAEGPYREINAGQCRRYHDLAGLDLLEGRAGVSLFQSQIRAMPYRCDLLERHPMGSQCFLPMDGSDYLVIVAEDCGDAPARPLAFLARADQGVNYSRNVWHGVLAPVSGGGLFAVIDRIGAGANLEEHRLATPLTVTLA
ncbi:MAG: ureidoglycolate lyase [Pseudomonadota bacterium]